MRNIKNIIMAGFQNSSTTSVASAPARRGRKATPAVASVAEDVFGFDYPTDDTADVVEADATPVRAPAAAEAPKKRGRPRKNPPAAEVVVPAPKAPKEKKAKAPRAAKKVLAALAPKAVEGEVPPTDEERKKQLRCLVREYQALTNQIRATKQRTGPYTMKETGEVRQSPLNQEQKDALLRNAAAQETQRAGVLRQIEKILVHFPLYSQFIKDVAGVGVACAGLLLANIDWTRCEKVSSLQQFCGMGVRVDDEGKGHAQRKQAGTPLDYREEIKTALWHCFAQSMVKAKDGRRVVDHVAEDGTKVYATDEDGNEIRTGNEAVQNSPYFRRMVEYKHRLLSSPRYREEDNTFDGRKGGKAIVNNMAYRPAAQLFLEHLYILGRTLAGLGVWPSYEAVKLGYGHGGKVAVNAPKFLTLAEAFAAVGVPMPAAVA